MSVLPASSVRRGVYRPALDGLRALAVLAVMVYHSSTGWGQGGFLGVDVFFVLSGYLITGLLLSHREREGRIDVIEFYRSRARRLLPAVLVLVSVVCVIGPKVLSAGAHAALRGDALSSLFYVANWRFILAKESYFDQFGDPSPLRHLWTLSIEEQYYLAFPLVLAALLTVAAGRWRVLAAALLVLATASAVWGAVLYDPAQDPSRIYYGTDTRAHELLIGAALAVILPRLVGRVTPRARPFVDVAGALALLAIVTAFVVARETATFTFVGGTVVFALLVALVLISVETAPHALLGRTLGAVPLAWIGRLSYSLYLWHWPVYVLLSPDRTGGGRTPLFIVQVLVTLALACASYYLIEQPIRRGRLAGLGVAPRRIVVAAALPLVIVLVVATTSRAPAAPPKLEAGQSTSSSVGGADATQRIVIVGDSVGAKMAAYFPTTTYPGVSVSGVAILGCGTAEQWLVVNDVAQAAGNDDCKGQFAKWGKAVAAADPQVIIWNLGAWEVYDHDIDGTVLKVGSAAYASYLTGQMERALKEFGGTARVVIPNVPCYDQGSYVYAGQDIAVDRNEPARGEVVNTIIDDFAAAHADRVTVVDVRSWLCPGGSYQKDLNGVNMRDDGVHYSEAGVPRFWAWLMPQIKPFLAE